MNPSIFSLFAMDSLRVCLCVVVFTGAKIAYVRWGVPPPPPEPQAEPVAEPEPVENVGQGQ